MPDIVEIRGLRVLGTHGVLEEERQRAQPFEVDIDVETDLAPAGRSDDLRDTIDYGWVARQAAGVVGGRHAELIERVAQDIADAVLTDERITAVTVVVRKLRPPVPLDVATTAVRITRRR
jgi:dihydroneopterin aldolase